MESPLDMWQFRLDLLVNSPLEDYAEPHRGTPSATGLCDRLRSHSLGVEVRNRSSQSPLMLDKWYLDCVSEEGEAFIGYAATLRVGALPVHYSSALHRRPDGKTTAATSLRRYVVPALDGTSAIRWFSRPLGVDGSWVATASSIQRTLYESEAGSIAWHCLQPRSECQVKLDSGRCLTGLGYVEHLALSIPPWKLPITELRWGRFLTDRNALVWIDWRGSHPLSLVFHNGIRLECVSIRDQQVLLPGVRNSLAFSESRVIREGPLIQTALSAIPGIKRLFPVHSHGTYECKWLSRGQWIEDGKAAATGWAIHEVVRFA